MLTELSAEMLYIIITTLLGNVAALWKNEKYSIYDCYAISLDEEENLWFYYYDEFRLVRTNVKEDFVFELPIEGSGALDVYKRQLLN